MKRKKIVPTTLVLGGVLLLVWAGGLMASNMGFKVECLLQGPQPGVSRSGTNFIGLPYNQQLSLQTAKDWFRDMNGGGGVQFTNQHRKIDDAFEIYTFGGGTIPPVGWNLTSGECYIVKTGVTQNYRIVGTHDPTLMIDLLGPAAGVSRSGTNFYAHPYHSAAVTARDLFREIGGGVQFINQHRKVDDRYEIYTYGGGTIPPDGWLLNYNECYIVKVGFNTSFIPAHY